jgi:hypothetical protein
MTNKIKPTDKTLPKVKATGSTLPKVDGEKAMKDLGAVPDLPPLRGFSDGSHYVDQEVKIGESKLPRRKI